MFKFRLQRVLELREKKEQEVATALAEARDRAELARRAVDDLARVRDASARPDGGARSVGELRQAAFVLEQLDRRIALAAIAAAERDADVARRQAELNLAFQDRRVLDRLKERHLDAWRANEVAIDRQTMDAIALTRFGKRDE